MPKSPKASLVPPLAAPVRLGWCCLRCLVLRGISMTSALLSGGLGSARGRCRSLGGRGRRGGAGRSLGRRGLGPTLAAVGAVATLGATATGRAAAVAGLRQRRGLGLALGAGARDL